MEDSYLLSDEFFAFSQKIKDIFDKKKAKKAELKALYDKIQAELKAFDAEAAEAEEEFEKWKSSKKN